MDMPALEVVPVVLKTDGLEDVGVKGKSFVGRRGLAVTPALLRDRRIVSEDYFVTHTPSGLRFGEHPLDETDALALMSDLYATGVDWTKDADALTPEERARARGVLRRRRLFVEVTQD